MKSESVLEFGVVKPRAEADTTKPLVIPTRARDIVMGCVKLQNMFAVHTTRPAHSHGRPDCCHPESELAFLEAGSTYGKIGGRPVVVREGQMLVIPRDVEHSTRTDAEPSRGLYLQLRPAIVDEVADGLGVPTFADAPHDAVAIPVNVRGVVASLRGELACERPSELLVEHLGLYLTGALLRFEHERALMLDGERQTVPRCTVKRLERTIELMRALPHERHGLANLAATAGLSKFRYAHLFREHYGISPHAYLVRLRVRLGAARLLETDEPIGQIAFDLGFASSSALGRHFQRHFGQAPSTYRAIVRTGSKI